jgi:hypothetical protein
MSQALHYVRLSFFSMSSFLTYARSTVMVCLTLLLASPMWSVPPTAFQGVVQTQSTGSVSLSLLMWRWIPPATSTSRIRATVKS